MLEIDASAQTATTTCIAQIKRSASITAVMKKILRRGMRREPSGARLPEFEIVRAVDGSVRQVDGSVRTSQEGTRNR